MKTQNETQKNLKETLPKIALALVFFSVLIFNQACQLKPRAQHEMSVQDEVRISHAEELLPPQEIKTVQRSLTAFNGDTKFSSYIQKFIKNKGKKIKNPEAFTQTLLQVSEQHSYDPIFLLAVMKTESSFNPKALGSAGEIGLMQLKPETAEWICKMNNIEWRGAQALKDPEYNILVGAYYFQYLKTNLKSKGLKYVNAYNMGLTSLKRTPTSEVQKHPYFGKVISNYLSIYKELKKIKEKSSYSRI
jgi:soluble lytic murein transglycosylase